MAGTETGSFVLDSSVALGAFFVDEQDDYSLAVWRSLGSATAFVPALWHVELGNILSRAVRLRRITRPQLDECWERLRAVGLRTLPLDADASHWTQRSVEWDVTAYDACYLDAAFAHRLPLATKDQRLGEAARKVGVPLYLK
jgi:predicted nucleic acid-binding protein